MSSNKFSELNLLILQDLLTPDAAYSPAPTARLMSLRSGLLLLTVALAAVHCAIASADAGKNPLNTGVQDLGVDFALAIAPQHTFHAVYVHAVQTFDAS